MLSRLGVACTRRGPGEAAPALLYYLFAQHRGKVFSEIRIAPAPTSPGVGDGETLDARRDNGGLPRPPEPTVRPFSQPQLRQ